MNYFEAFIALSVISSIIIVVVGGSSRQGLLTKIYQALALFACSAILMLSLSAIAEGWQDGMGDAFAFLQAILLFSIGLRHFIKKEIEQAKKGG